MGDRSGGVGNFAQPGLSFPPPCLQTLEGGTSANANHAEGYEHHHEHYSNKNYWTRTSQSCAMSRVGEECLDRDPFTNSFDDGG